MDIKLLSHSNMGTDGAFLLRSYIGKQLPMIDLLVRECFQNSLDAGPKIAGSKVTVDVLSKSVSAKPINALFSGVDKFLTKDFDEEIEYLAFRDSGTVGLGGKYEVTESSIDTKSRFRKLVYEFGKPNTDAGSGGSWGVGKTVCFKPGNGIVIYYSRIRKSAITFESRLIAILVENNNNPNSLLERAGIKEGPENLGVAWWGRNEGSNCYPIVDEKEIAKILKLFDIPPYTGDETGTCVIIPYVDTESLIKNSNDIGYNSRRNLSLEIMVERAVQRWYFTRLNNKDYPYGSWLEYRFNGEKLRKTDEKYLFKKLTEMYMVAVNKIEKNIDCKDDVMHCVEIPSRFMVLGKKKAFGELVYMSGTPAEIFSFQGEVDKQDIEELLNITIKNKAKPIVLYCRESGMILNYEHDTSGWTAGFAKMNDAEMTVAFFHPYGKAKPTDYNIEWDTYLRLSEENDHRCWKNNNINYQGAHKKLVNNMIDNVARKLADAFGSDEDISRQSNLGWQRKLGAGLLPKGFGTGSSKPAKNGHQTGKPKPVTIGNHNMTVKLGTAVYSRDGKVTVSFTMDLKDASKTKEANLYFKTHTAQREYSAEDWEKDGSEFPLSVTPNECLASGADGCMLSIEPLITTKKASCYGVVLSGYPTEGQQKIAGQISYKVKNKAISVKLSCE